MYTRKKKIIDFNLNIKFKYPLNKKYSILFKKHHDYKFTGKKVKKGTCITCTAKCIDADSINFFISVCDKKDNPRSVRRR